MTMKSYEKRVARLVQEAVEVSYSTALRWTREDQAARPEAEPKEARALRIVESRIVRKP
jgi:hypothetical protein